MGNYIEGKSRKQLFLLPPNLDEWVPKKHPARAIDRFVDSLNTDSMDLQESNDSSGRKRYPPREMIKILMYSYSIGVTSSRKIERLTYENVVLRWLSGGLHPDYRTIARFRRENSKVLEGLLTKTVKLYREVYLDEDNFDGVVFIDSTCIYADANGESFIDEDKIRKRVKKILEEAERKDKEEDEKYGKDGSGDKLSDKSLEELEDITRRLAEEVNREMKEGKKGKEEKEEFMGKLNALAKKIKIYKREADSNSDKKGRVSTTDPDARFMRHYLHGKQPSYRIQVSSDRNRLIVNFDAVKECSDHHQFNNMIKRSESNLSNMVKIGVADKGYYNQKELEPVLDRGIIPVVKKEDQGKEKRKKGQFPHEEFKYNEEKDVVICPGGKELTYRYTYKQKDRKYRKYRVSSSICNNCPMKEKCIQSRVEGGGKAGKNYSIQEDRSFIKKHRKIMENEENLKLYNRRKETVEHVFGVIKRNMGFRRFNLRGHDNIKGEFGLIGAIYNLNKIINLIGFKEFMDNLTFEGT